MTPDHDRLAAASARLHALAAGLCQDSGIGLAVEPAEWAWNPMSRTLTVAREDLLKKGSEHCAGLVAHEMGHYFISRYLFFPPLSELDPRIERLLLNALEDPRANHWMRTRYPGTRPWLVQVYRDEGRRGPSAAVPHILSFLLATIVEAESGWRPRPAGELPEPVAAALDASRGARQRFVATVPPPDLGPATLTPEETAAYRDEVWPHLLKRHHLPPLTGQERRVQLVAWHAHRLIEEEILPLFCRLLDAEATQIARLLEVDAAMRERAERAVERHALGLAGRVVAGAHEREERAGGLPSDASRRLALDLLASVVEESQIGPPPAGRRPAGSLSDSTLVEPPTPEADPPPLRPLRLTRYDAAYQGIAPQVDALTRHLEAILLPRRRLAERAGYPSGTRVDLRRLMAFAADPRRHGELWRRKSLPDRREVALSLLVDLSGSMRGGKDEAAMLGSLVLAETLDRLSIPFEVNGFQDELIPFCAFGEGLNDATRAALLEIPLEVAGERPGGHNRYRYNDDGPCLLEAASHLHAYPASDRCLIVVSDGHPEGDHSDADDLRDAIATLQRTAPPIDLIGLGLGPETDHVTGYYPNAIANIPVDAFADQLAALLQEVVGVAA